MNLARTDARREILTLAAIGLLAGLLLGNLAAGAFAAWRTGGIVAETGFATFLAHAPWAVGRMTEPFRIGLVIFAVTGLVCAALLPAIARRPQLTSHGAARWAKPEEIRRAGLSARLEALQGPVYAKLGAPGSNAPYLTSSEIPHSLIAAPTGSGKGVGVVIPTLLTWRGSVICLDVKGENFAKTARRRAALGDRVLYSANDGEHGRELFVFDVTRMRDEIAERFLGPPALLLVELGQLSRNFSHAWRHLPFGRRCYSPLARMPIPQMENGRWWTLNSTMAWRSSPSTGRMPATPYLSRPWTSSTQRSMRSRARPRWF